MNFTLLTRVARHLAGRLSIFCALAALAMPASADIFNVDVGTDNGQDPTITDHCAEWGNAAHCGLRAAITVGNNRAGAHIINLSPSVLTINVINGALPTLNAQFTINGNHITTINGNNHGCLSLADSGTAALGHGNGANGSILTNLVIGNCSGSAISANGHGLVISGNFLGVDRTGTVAMPNTGHGLSLSASHVYPDTSSNFLLNMYNSFPLPPEGASTITAFSSNLVTAMASLSPVMVTGNVISGNQLNGIEIFSQNLAGVIVSSNKIGTDATGNVAIPNGGSGVHLVGSAFGNLIGPDNIISGNAADGIRVDAGAVMLPNFIMGNRIGLAATNSQAHIGNGGNGIRTDTSPSSDIASMNPSGISVHIGPANLIADNKGANNNAFPDTLGSDSAGILITGSSNGVKVVGNTIGIAEFPAGTPLASKAFGNAGDGIIVTASGNTIGGTASSSANVIAANARHGIVVSGSSTTNTSVLGNYIGVHSGLPGNLALGNGVDGIHIDAASMTTIGGPGATDFNTIAGNGRNGVKIRNGGANNGWSNMLQRNPIFHNGTALPGIGIDLDYAENAVDPLHSEFPANYVNLDQAAPRICTGPADSGSCSGSVAPSSDGSTTTLNWTIATHGPANFRMEFFKIDSANDNSATSMTFLGEQSVTTDAFGSPTAAGCSSGRCSVTLGAAANGATVLMTATDVTPLTDQPGGGTDWKSNLKCFAGNLGAPLLSQCNVNNTSEYSNAVTVPAAQTAQRNALFINASTSSKNTVLRLINLNSQSAQITANAYNEAGSSVGTPNAVITTLAARQMLALTSAQLESAIGYLPASSTAKYRIVFNSNAPGLEIINFIKDNATGNLTLGQAQTGNRASNSSLSSTRNMLFDNPSTSTNKTSIVRLINLGNQSGIVTATAYNEAGNQVGVANAGLGTFGPRQMLTFASSQLEAALGFTPASPTAKYRIVFNASLPSFELINFVKDNATGKLTLGQAQIDDRPAPSGNSSTRNAYFVNASTSTNKTTVVRLINLSGSSGSITATARNEAGAVVGVANASLGTLPAQQMLTFSSAQLESLIGYAPASPTAKYRVAFSVNLPSFELINFVKDNLTGNLTLAQAQIDNQQANAGASSTRNLLFDNPSTSSNKTTVVRIINTNAQAGVLSATAYDEAGNVVGTPNANFGSIGAQQMLTFSSAQLESTIGFVPSSPTAKYRVVFAANLPSFELINYIKDNLTGNVTLGQGQID